jgi:RNAse (barnase) inhibitor barstar
MPNRATVFRWLSRYEEFRQLYGFAREWQLDCLWDDVIVIVDDRSVNIARKDFVTSALKRRIARLVPKKYGRPRLGQSLL